MRVYYQSEKKISEQTFWYSGLALPLSFLYYVIVTLKTLGYKFGLLKVHKFDLSVISIGNIEAGGVGKTPFVSALSSYLLNSKKEQSIILMRGYKSNLKKGETAIFFKDLVCVANKDGEILVRGKITNFRTLVNCDEACLLNYKNPQIPVICGKDRVLSYKVYNLIMETLSLPKPNRIILDDGFQKLSIKRDIDIVLLDSLSPFGNGHLLPLGRLRETPKALKRADIVLKVRKESSKASSKEVDASSIFYSTILQNKDSLPTHTHVFCAIGKPKFFINFFEKNNIVIDSAVIKTDHDSFKIKDFSHLDASANLSLTLKDYLRQKEFFDELNFNLYIFDLDLDESYLANLIS